MLDFILSPLPLSWGELIHQCIIQLDADKAEDLIEGTAQAFVKARQNNKQIPPQGRS